MDGVTSSCGGLPGGASSLAGGLDNTGTLGHCRGAGGLPGSGSGVAYLRHLGGDSIGQRGQRVELKAILVREMATAFDDDQEPLGHERGNASPDGFFIAGQGHRKAGN